MLIAYFLSMPNCGSWNGKWTGAGRKYVKVRKYDKKIGTKIMEDCEEIMERKYSGSIFDRRIISETPTSRFSKSWYYRWNDGWGANITAETIDSKTATKLRKESDGFCGYEWMIDSIEKCGTILNSEGE